LVFGQVLKSICKILNNFLISSFIPDSTAVFQFNSANKFKIELIHGFLALNTFELTECLKTEQIKGIIKCNLPFSHALNIKALKSKSFAKIGLSFDILYSPSHSPKFFKVSFDLFSELIVSQLFVAYFFTALIVAFIMVFVSLIGCIIMMKIYVHNTALVEQPLKLGRIEA